MAKQSAGLLVYRIKDDKPELFLVHPGGPFWAKKDQGAWSIPKGEYGDEEDALPAAKREFREETGFSIEGDFQRLTPVRQAGGKIVHAWAVEGDADASAIHSNTFSMEWPPKSGNQRQFPEVDRAGWFKFPEARKKILKGQAPLLEELEKIIESS